MAEVPQNLPRPEVHALQASPENTLDFYSGIILPEHGQEDQPEPEHPIVIRVLGQKTIGFYGVEVDLEDDTLYGFNALLHSPEAASAGALSQYGLHHRTPMLEFFHTLSNLQAIFNGLAKTDIIGSGTLRGVRAFVLNPNIVFTDERDPDDRAQREAQPSSHTAIRHRTTETPPSPKLVQQPVAPSVSRPLPTEKLGPSTSKERLVIYDESHFNATDSSDKRREHAISNVLAAYRDHPRVALKLAEQKFTPAGISGSSDELGNYLKFIGQFPLLTAEQEAELFTTIEAGLNIYKSLTDNANITPEQEAALIDMTVAHHKTESSNLRLVVSIARRYFRVTAMPPLDVIQEGNLGLKKAVSRFDHTTGYKFSTYGTWWIRQSVIRGIADQGRTIRLPVYAHDQLVQIKKSSAVLGSALGRKPTTAELVEATGLDEATIDLLQHMGRDPHSLSEPLDDDGALTLEGIAADMYTEEHDLVENLTLRGAIDKVFSSDKLDARDKAILAWYFELPDRLPSEYSPIPLSTQEVTHKEIGLLLGITRTGVIAAQQKALAKARAVLANANED